MWTWIRSRFCRALLAWVVVSALSLRAEGSYPGLEIFYHVRSLSMASAGTADGSGMDVTIANPSLLQSVQGGLLFSLIRYPADIQSEVVEWRMPWGNRMGAISIRHLGFGTFHERDEEGTKTGQFSAGETWLSLSLAHSLFHFLDVGITAGLFLSQIQNVAAELAVVTVGGAVTIPRYDMRVGITVRNLGATVESYTNYREPIPTSIHVGLTKKLAHLPLELSVDGGWWERSHGTIVRLGGEFSFPYDLKLRWGTSSHRVDLKADRLWHDIASGTSLGVGFSTENLSIDLGMEYRGFAGSALGVGLSTTL